MLDSLLLLKGWSLGSYLQIHNYLRDAAENGDEIENIPSIPKVVLRQKKTFQVIGQILLMASVFGRSLLVCYSHHQSKRQDLQDTLHGEEDGEGRVEVFQDHVVGCRRRVVLKEKGTLSVTAARPRCCFFRKERARELHLHHEHHRVESDHHEHRVLKRGRRHKVPQPVLEGLPVLRHVAGHRLGADGEVDAGALTDGREGRRT